MPQAMAEAEVGDDVYLEDPTVNRLQSRAAKSLAVRRGCCTSGSMGNLACIMAQTSRGQEVICEAGRPYLQNYEMLRWCSWRSFASMVARGWHSHLGQIAPAIREKVYSAANALIVIGKHPHMPAV